MGIPRRVSRNCAYCGKEFRPTLSHVKQGKGKYCSFTCGAKGRYARNRLHLAQTFPAPEIPKGSGYKYIPLSVPGKYAVVDDADYEELSRSTWCVLSCPSNEYAFRYLPRSGDPRQRTEFMHHVLMGKVLIDHRDGNGLNNRRNNLRYCTPAENARNQKVQKRPKSSRYKGVSFYKSYARWSAYITVNGKRTFLGYYDDEVSAALAYDEAARSSFGEFAHLNFPRQGGLITWNPGGEYGERG